MASVVIKPSTKKEKKLMAIFTYADNKKKTIHFGSSGMDDYTLKKDKEQRDRYRQRHKKDKLNIADSAGSLSYNILWGNSTNKRENINQYKKKFNLK
jgi:hypothetical protein